MGGEKEFETTQRTPDGQIIGTVRIHLNAGEVHFHDDNNKEGKRKVAMPVATWMGAWQDIQRRLGRKWQYFDPVNQTLLVVKTKAKKGAKGQAAAVDCTLRYLLILNDEADFRSHANVMSAVPRSRTQVKVADCRSLPEIFRELRMAG